MKRNKNRYVPIGMLFLILAIILKKVSDISDMTAGILYGISISILMIGIFRGRYE